MGSVGKLLKVTLNERTVSPVLFESLTAIKLVDGISLVLTLQLHAASLLTHARNGHAVLGLKLLVFGLHWYTLGY